MGNGWTVNVEGGWASVFAPVGTIRVLRDSESEGKSVATRIVFDLLTHQLIQPTDILLT